MGGDVRVSESGGGAMRFEHPFTIVRHNFLQEPILEYQISNHACFSCVKRQLSRNAYETQKYMNYGRYIYVSKTNAQNTKKIEKWRVAFL